MLRGSKSKKVIEKRHDQLSVYGIGAELSKPQWLQLARTLMQKNYILQDQEFGSLKLTSNARPILKGEQQIEIRLTQKREFSEKATTRKQTDLDYNRELFEQLRSCRKSLADQENVPPYVIFSDKTLVEMSAWFPQSNESLLQINGVGSVKLNRYGDAFLREIIDFCQAHQIAEIPNHNHASTPLDSSRTRERKTNPSGRHIVVGEKFAEVNCLDKVLYHFEIKLSTLLDHLHKYHTEVTNLPFSDAFIRKSGLLPDQQERVIQAFQNHGSERLRPAFEVLQEQVSYDELRLMRLHYLVHNSSPVNSKPDDGVPPSNKYTKEKQAQNLEKGLPKNAGFPWNDQERELLVADFDAGIKISDLAATHERTSDAIRSELKKLGLIDK